MLPSGEYNDEHARQEFRTEWWEYLARELGDTELQDAIQVDNPHQLRYFSITDNESRNQN